MRVSDYISTTLSEGFRVRHVFMLTGGGAMFLNHSIGKNPRIQTIFNQHEQACAMAAEGYARITNKPGVINVTTGPGGINALNGVFGAWTDSIPMLVLSGQVKRETYIRTYDLPQLRQLGDQEADIVSLAKHITKLAVTVTEPSSIRYWLERAWHTAQSGRPGPVWLDIPIDVQSSQVDVEAIQGYEPEDLEESSGLRSLAAQTLDRLAAAKRPVILAGKGIRLANAIEDFYALIRLLQIPVVPGWTAIDLLASDDSLNCGVAGDLGTRAGNFTVQNADVLLVLANRLGLRQVSYNWKSFARHAYKIQVDIDEAEFDKPTVHADLAIHADVRLFIREMLACASSRSFEVAPHREWLSWCQKRVERYPVVLPRHRVGKGNRINPYHFVDRLFAHLCDDDVIVCGNGTANVVGFQAARVKKGQRLIANTGDASMGYDLPASVGAAAARRGRRVICLAGDGSLQLNIQELQTVRHNQLPIKLFVLNNEGYLSIRQSQLKMFNGVTGEGPSSGVTFPDVIMIAEAYGLPAQTIEYRNLDEGISNALASAGPIVCDVQLDTDQGFEPRIAARQLADGSIVSSPLEDMYPFLDDDELRDNLFIQSLR